MMSLCRICMRIPMHLSTERTFLLRQNKAFAILTNHPFNA